ncbi:MAG: hypothetical protein IKN08_08415, partial [Bacteroidales bacterium]|nr:hypothetical protein [Bacteroidales bacterium]
GLGPGAGEKWISTGGDEGRDCREGREDDGFEGVYSYSLVYQFEFIGITQTPTVTWKIAGVLLA